MTLQMMTKPWTALTSALLMILCGAALAADLPVGAVIAVGAAIAAVTYVFLRSAIPH